MSGWDEGGIYYSDQAQFPRGGEGDSETVNRHAVLQRFKEFIRNFQRKSQPNVFPYRKALLSNPEYLLVNLADLISYDPIKPFLNSFVKTLPTTVPYSRVRQQKCWQVLNQGLLEALVKWKSRPGKCKFVEIISGSTINEINGGTIYFKTG